MLRIKEHGAGVAFKILSQMTSAARFSNIGKKYWWTKKIIKLTVFS